MNSVNSFGRLVAPLDGRDFRFLMRAAAPQIVAAVGKPLPRTLPYREGPVLDQGNEPSCTGFSAKGFLNAAPIMSVPTVTPTGSQIYKLAQTLDEWEGSDYEGSSVRGAMKALKQLGHIASYTWGVSVEEAVAWVNGGYGTLIIGSEWFQSFSSIGRDGFMTMPAQLATPLGGHAYRLSTYSTKVGGFLVKNSWSTSWGRPKASGERTGDAYMSKEVLRFLLARDGELAGPVQIKLKPIKP